MATTHTGSPFERFELIGRGRLSTIYDGFDHQMQRPVAIKQLHEESREDEVKAARFWREARFLGQLNHGRLVRVYAFDEPNHQVIMERLAGSVAELVEQGPQPADRVRGLLRDALDGLTYLHSQGKLHGGIGPRHLLLDSQGGLKLSGTVGMLPGDEFPQPESSEDHFAPELLNPEVFGQPGFGVDLYALGMVFAELLCGRAKFRRQFKGFGGRHGNDALALASWHASTEAFPPIAQLAPAVPVDLAQVIDGLVRKCASERWGTAEAALRVLSPAVSEPRPMDVGATIDSKSSAGDEPVVIVQPPPLGYPPPGPENNDLPTSPLVWLRTQMARRPVLARRGAPAVAAVVLCLATWWMLAPPRVVPKSGAPVGRFVVTLPAPTKPAARKLSPAPCRVTILPDCAESDLGKVVIRVDGRRVLPRSNAPAARQEGPDGAGLDGPFETQLDPGEHVLRVECPHHAPYEETVMVKSATQQVRARLRRLDYQVAVRTAPEAEVYVDEQPWRGESGVFLGRCPAGAHLLRVSSAHHQTHTETIVVEGPCQHVVELNSRPETPQFSVAIDTWPRGAEVFVDDARIGLSDCSTYLSPGTHSVRIVKAGYREFVGRIDVAGVQKNHKTLRPLEPGLAAERPVLEPWDNDYFPLPITLRGWSHGTAGTATLVEVGPHRLLATVHPPGHYDLLELGRDSVAAEFRVEAMDANGRVRIIFRNRFRPVTVAVKSPYPGAVAGG